MLNCDVCAQLLSTPVDVEMLWTIPPPPGSSAYGIVQAKMLNWVVISHSSNFDSLHKKKKKKIVISLTDFKYKVILLLLYKQLVEELLLQPDHFQEDFSLHSWL